jgi:hypothetical protein
VCDTASLRKDRYGAEFVPPVIPRPGEELGGLIRQGRDDGRPVWRVYSLVVPRNRFVAIPSPETGEPTLTRPLAVDRDRRPYFRPRVLLYLETASPATLELLQNDDRVELRRLTAAALRDIYGYTPEKILEALPYRNQPEFDEAVARRDVRAGRKLWRLCALGRGAIGLMESHPTPGGGNLRT